MLLLWHISRNVAVNIKKASDWHVYQNSQVLCNADLIIKNNYRLITSSRNLLGKLCDWITFPAYCPNYVVHICYTSNTLRWRHNERDGVSNHQPHDCLLNRLFKAQIKETSKLRVTGLYAGNSTVTGEFPEQRASNSENVSIWWRHHDILTSHAHEENLILCWICLYHIPTDV